MASVSFAHARLETRVKNAKLTASDGMNNNYFDLVGSSKQ